MVRRTDRQNWVERLPCWFGIMACCGRLDGMVALPCGWMRCWVLVGGFGRSCLGLMPWSE